MEKGLTSNSLSEVTWIYSLKILGERNNRKHRWLHCHYRPQINVDVVMAMVICDNCGSQKKILIPVQKNESTTGENSRALRWCLYCIRNAPIE